MTTTANAAIKLIELPLGGPGIDYVRSSLRQETSFCRAVAPLVVKSGQVCGLVPEGTTAARAVEFDRGGLVGTRSTDRWLVEHMLSVCHAKPEGLLIFDEPWGGRKGDPAVMGRRGQRLFHEKFVYHYVEANTANRQLVEDAMKSPGGFLFVAAFSLYTLAASALSSDLTIRDDQVMRNIAVRTEELYISAYDRESFVVWRK